METTPVLKDAHFHWFYLGSAIYAKCGRLNHTSLGCGFGRKLLSGKLPRQVFSDFDKSRLATIYAKRSALVTWPVAFDDASWASVVNESSFPPFSGQNVFLKNGSSSVMKPTLLVSLEMNDRFAALECSLASLADPGHQPLMTPSSQNQGADIVMSESSGVVTSDETVVGTVIFDLSVVLKMEETLKNFSVMVMSLSAKINNAGLVPIIHSS
ncbi:hypothetical protein G9A89_021420 [Geosiphon pyriformis]|nr:hypothetical protein G9A89_021420 [Geosiphon pyriformis]